MIRKILYFSSFSLGLLSLVGSFAGSAQAQEAPASPLPSPLRYKSLQPTRERLLHLYLSINSTLAKEVRQTFPKYIDLYPKIFTTIHLPLLACESSLELDSIHSSMQEAEALLAELLNQRRNEQNLQNEDAFPTSSYLVQTKEKDAFCALPLDSKTWLQETLPPYPEAVQSFLDENESLFDQPIPFLFQPLVQRLQQPTLSRSEIQTWMTLAVMTKHLYSKLFHKVDEFKVPNKLGLDLDKLKIENSILTDAPSQIEKVACTASQDNANRAEDANQTCIRYRLNPEQQLAQKILFQKNLNSFRLSRQTPESELKSMAKVAINQLHAQDVALQKLLGTHGDQPFCPDCNPYLTAFGVQNWNYQDLYALKAATDRAVLAYPALLSPETLTSFDPLWPAFASELNGYLDLPSGFAPSLRNMGMVSDHASSMAKMVQRTFERKIQALLREGNLAPHQIGSVFQTSMERSLLAHLFRQYQQEFAKIIQNQEASYQFQAKALNELVMMEQDFLLDLFEPLLKQLEPELKELTAQFTSLFMAEFKKNTDPEKTSQEMWNERILDEMELAADFRQQAEDMFSHEQLLHALETTDAPAWKNLGGLTTLPRTIGESLKGTKQDRFAMEPSSDQNKPFVQQDDFFDQYYFSFYKLLFQASGHQSPMERFGTYLTQKLSRDGWTDSKLTQEFKRTHGILDQKSFVHRVQNKLDQLFVGEAAEEESVHQDFDRWIAKLRFSSGKKSIMAKAYKELKSFFFQQGTAFAKKISELDWSEAKKKEYLSRFIQGELDYLLLDEAESQALADLLLEEGQLSGPSVSALDLLRFPLQSDAADKKTSFNNMTQTETNPRTWKDFLAKDDHREQAQKVLDTLLQSPSHLRTFVNDSFIDYDFSTLQTTLFSPFPLEKRVNRMYQDKILPLETYKTDLIRVFYTWAEEVVQKNTEDYFALADPGLNIRLKQDSLKKLDDTMLPLHQYLPIHTIKKPDRLSDYLVQSTLHLWKQIDEKYTRKDIDKISQDPLLDFSKPGSIPSILFEELKEIKPDLLGTLVERIKKIQKSISDDEIELDLVDFSIIHSLFGQPFNSEKFERLKEPEVDALLTQLSLEKYLLKLKKLRDQDPSGLQGTLNADQKSAILSFYDETSTPIVFNPASRKDKLWKPYAEKEFLNSTSSLDGAELPITPKALLQLINQSIQTYTEPEEDQAAEDEKTSKDEKEGKEATPPAHKPADLTMLADVLTVYQQNKGNEFWADLAGKNSLALSELDKVLKELDAPGTAQDVSQEDGDRLKDWLNTLEQEKQTKLLESVSNLLYKDLINTTRTDRASRYRWTNEQEKDQFQIQSIDELLQVYNQAKKLLLALPPELQEEHPLNQVFLKQIVSSLQMYPQNPNWDEKVNALSFLMETEKEELQKIDQINQALKQYATHFKAEKNVPQLTKKPFYYEHADLIHLSNLSTEALVQELSTRQSEQFGPQPRVLPTDIALNELALMVPAWQRYMRLEGLLPSQSTLLLQDLVEQDADQDAAALKPIAFSSSKYMPGFVLRLKEFEAKVLADPRLAKVFTDVVQTNRAALKMHFPDFQFTGVESFFKESPTWKKVIVLMERLEKNTEADFQGRTFSALAAKISGLHPGESTLEGLVDRYALLAVDSLGFEPRDLGSWKNMFYQQGEANLQLSKEDWVTLMDSVVAEDQILGQKRIYSTAYAPNLHGFGSLPLFKSDHGYQTASGRSGRVQTPVEGRTALHALAAAAKTPWPTVGGNAAADPFYFFAQYLENKVQKIKNKEIQSLQQDSVWSQRSMDALREKAFLSNVAVENQTLLEMGQYWEALLEVNLAIKILPSKDAMLFANLFRKQYGFQTKYEYIYQLEDFYEDAFQSFFERFATPTLDGDKLKRFAQVYLSWNENDVLKRIYLQTLRKTQQNIRQTATELVELVETDEIDNVSEKLTLLPLHTLKPAMEWLQNYGVGAHLEQEVEKIATQGKWLNRAAQSINTVWLVSILFPSALTLVRYALPKAAFGGLARWGSKHVGRHAFSLASSGALAWALGYLAWDHYSHWEQEQESQGLKDQWIHTYVAKEPFIGPLVSNAMSMQTMDKIAGYSNLSGGVVGYDTLRSTYLTMLGSAGSWLILGVEGGFATFFGGKAVYSLAQVMRPIIKGIGETRWMIHSQSKLYRIWRGIRESEVQKLLVQENSEAGQTLISQSMVDGAFFNQRLIPAVEKSKLFDINGDTLTFREGAKEIFLGFIQKRLTSIQRAFPDRGMRPTKHSAQEVERLKARQRFLEELVQKIHKDGSFAVDDLVFLFILEPKPNILRTLKQGPRELRALYADWDRFQSELLEAVLLRWQKTTSQLLVSQKGDKAELLNLAKGESSYEALIGNQGKNVTLQDLENVGLDKQSFFNLRMWKQMWELLETQDPEKNKRILELIVDAGTSSRTNQASLQMLRQTIKRDFIPPVSRSGWFKKKEFDPKELVDKIKDAASSTQKSSEEIVAKIQSFPLDQEIKVIVDRYLASEKVRSFKNKEKLQENVVKALQEIDDTLIEIQITRIEREFILQDMTNFLLNPTFHPERFYGTTKYHFLRYEEKLRKIENNFLNTLKAIKEESRTALFRQHLEQNESRYLHLYTFRKTVNAFEKELFKLFKTDPGADRSTILELANKHQATITAAGLPDQIVQPLGNGAYRIKVSTQWVQKMRSEPDFLWFYDLSSLNGLYPNQLHFEWVKY